MRSQPVKNPLTRGQTTLGRKLAARRAQMVEISGLLLCAQVNLISTSPWNQPEASAATATATNTSRQLA